MSPVPRPRERAARGALALLAVLLAMAWALPGLAAAQASPAEVALAQRWAPVVMIPRADDCPNGLPFAPIDVDLLFGNDEIALRGPWDRTNVVGVAPRATDLGRPLIGYHLDFPGDTLDPGCDFEDWSRRLTAAGPATAYAHVTAERGKPGLISLQYWFFYVFNDWNNNHEGDWEMIQIVFPADTAAEALRVDPVEVGYSQHSSGERAAWGDPKLALVDGTHPVVYPAAGSHANFFGSELYLMRSQAEGVGCDDTRDVFREVRPVVDVVPSAERDYRRTHPWLVFEGRWGERQAVFFNGPTGPNMKTQWIRPITWAREDWRAESFTVPTGGPIAPQATDIFCGAVALGSETLRRAKTSPPLTIAIVGGIAVLLLWGLSRTEWRPATRRLRGRRAWGQVVASAWRIYRDRPRLWMGIGLVFVPLGLVTTIGQWLIFRVSGLSLLVDEAGERNAFVASLAVGFGLLVSLLGFAVVQAATARALREIEAGREVTPLGAYRALRPRVRPLVAALAVAVPVQVVLDLTVVLIPVAVFLLVRWSLIGVLAGLDDVDRPGLLPRSVALVRRHWWRTATLGLGVTTVGLLLGPLVGTLALLISSASFDLINIVSALVYVAALPFPAIVMTLLAGDLAARGAEAEAGAAVERDDEAVASA